MYHLHFSFQILQIRFGFVGGFWLFLTTTGLWWFFLGPRLLLRQWRHHFRRRYLIVVGRRCQRLSQRRFVFFVIGIIFVGHYFFAIGFVQRRKFARRRCSRRRCYSITFRSILILTGGRWRKRKRETKVKIVICDNVYNNNLSISFRKLTNDIVVSFNTDHWRRMDGWVRFQNEI